MSQVLVLIAGGLGNPIEVPISEAKKKEDSYAV